MQSSHCLLDGVDRIAVLRPNAVGDFVFALPALHALKAAYGQAELVLVGKAWHRDFLHGRPGPVDRVAVMPPVPGVGAPVDTAAQADASETAAFLDAMREERFDLALQMFGSGRYSNPFIQRFGARVTAGSRAAGAPPLDRWVAYREPVPRRLALLEIAGLVGAQAATPPAGARAATRPNTRLATRPAASLPELSLTEADRIEAARVLPPVAGARFVVLQPGASDPRRRWPARQFAALGDALAAQGATILVHGTREERALVDEVVGGMHHPATNLAGRLSLGGLCGVLARAALLVSNDTGPLHLALALGVPSVGIFWLTNLIEGMPLRPSLLRAALSVRTRCPVCGTDNRNVRCPHDPSFVDDVGVAEVTALARQALED